MYCYKCDGCGEVVDERKTSVIRIERKTAIFKPRQFEVCPECEAKLFRWLRASKPIPFEGLGDDCYDEETTR